MLKARLESHSLNARETNGELLREKVVDNIIATLPLGQFF
jgi:hypothetical protein